MSFENRREKGKLGEAEVDRVILAKGYIPYRPDFDGPHPFDRLCATPDKRRLLVVESKCKPHRRWYPDTGINRRHYDEYCYLRQVYRLDTFLAFVDEDEQKIYGNLLTVLDRPRIVTHLFQDLEYPLEMGGIRYFPLEAMETIATLDAEVLVRIRNLSERNPDFKPKAHD